MFERCKIKVMKGMPQSVPGTGKTVNEGYRFRYY